MGAGGLSNDWDAWVSRLGSRGAAASSSGTRIHSALGWVFSSPDRIRCHLASLGSGPYEEEAGVETLQQKCHLNACVAGLTILGKMYQKKMARTILLGLPESGRAIKLGLFGLCGADNNNGYPNNHDARPHGPEQLCVRSPQDPK